MNDGLKSFLDKIAEPMRCALSSHYRRERRERQREVRREEEYQYYRGLLPEQYPEALKKWYKDCTGKNLNLENPQTYNEKIQWLKLYDSTPLKTKLADKYLVREWVAEKIGGEYLIPLLGVYEKFDDINFDALPEKFVMKANHGSTWNLIVEDKSKLNMAGAKKKFDFWMNRNFAFCYGLELQYKNIVPKIIIEEYIENGNNKLYGYKFWCFGGKVQFIMFLMGEAGEKKALRVTVYDTEWNRMPFEYSFPSYEKDVEKPDNLGEMINLAETLAAGFPFVRVDFYRLNDGTIKLGEMTFTPSSGTCKWDPPEYDKIIGDLIKLPTDKK